MDYDKILEKIGEFGRWQKKSFLLLSIPAFVGGMVVLTTAFTVQMPKEFICYDACENYDASVKFRSILDTKVIAVEEDNEIDKSVFCDKVPFERNSNDSCAINYAKSDGVCDRESEYFFDDFTMKTSVVTDNKILCMESIKLYKTICDSFFMLGYFVGGVIFGLIADTMGRKVSVSIAILVSFIGTGIGPLLHNHWLYAVLRIIPGSGSIACYLMAFTLSVEIIGKKEQFFGIPWNMTVFSFVGNMIAIPFALGEAANGLLAYIFPVWTEFQFAVAFICGISVFAWFVLPESPRWLIEEKKFICARKLIRTAARQNGVALTDEDLQLVKNDEEEVKDERLSRESSHHSIGSIVEEEIVEGIFHPVLRGPTITLFLIWTVVALIYYGTSFGVEELHLAPNHYLGVCIVAAVEVPAYILTALAMDATGRKPLLILTLLITALSCLTAAVVPPGGFRIFLILLAKFSIASTFTVSRIYTSELYPTHMRATALGTCKSVSALGCMAAPWVGEFLPKSWEHGMTASLIIYAVGSAIAGFLSFQLADTVGFPLPSTLEDVQYIFKYQKPMLQIATPDWDPLKNIEMKEKEEKV